MTGNEKKFRALVTDFVNTTAELGGTIDPEIVTVELRQRIQFIAAQIGVTEATVPRNHMPNNWGRDMARRPTGKSKNATPTSTPNPTNNYR